MYPKPARRGGLVVAFVITLLQLAAGLPGRAEGDLRPNFGIPNLAPFGPLVISERHRALIRTMSGSAEIIGLPAGVAGMALSPDHE